MLDNLAFIRDFMDHYQYPEDAKKTFLALQKEFTEDKAFGDRMEAIVKGYLFPETEGLSEALNACTALAEERGISPYTMHFMFLLNCMPVMKERYEAAGLSDELYYTMMDDLRCKLLECLECKGVPGTFVAWWNDGTMKLTRFGLGRFQYEFTRFHGKEPFVTKSGKIIRPGDRLINFHIPANGTPLTDEVRMDSYRRAYAFFRAQNPQSDDHELVFCCHSWLLFPKHAEFLPESSNIRKFLSDFEIVSSEEKDYFDDNWRVFGRYADLPADKLPRDTALRRAYADWLTAGNKTGEGYGVFVFDGEKIVR